MGDIVNLPQRNNGSQPIKGCATCRFFKQRGGPYYDVCLADAEYAQIVRRDACAYGELWEAIPPRIGLLTRIWRWLV